MARTFFISQAFKKVGRRIEALPSMSFSSEVQAVARAERDGGRYAGAVAYRQTADDDTGEPLDEPKILSRHGVLPDEFSE